MSAVIVNPAFRPASTVRIHCGRCVGPNAEHSRCPGVVHSKGVRFVCSCPCHIPERVAAFDGKMAAAEGGAR